MSIPLAGAKVRAADLAAIFPLNTDAWPTYVPTFTQSATITKTVGVARYWKIGRWVHGEVNLSATSAGTANNEVQVGVPFTMAAGYVGHTSIGSGSIYDASANTFYSGSVIIASTTAVRLIINATSAYAGQTGGGFAVAIASGDQVTVCFDYMAAP